MKKAFEKAMSNLKIRRKLKVKAILSLILLISHRWDDHCDENRDSWGTTKLNFLQLGAKYGLFMMVLIFLHILMTRKILKLEAKFSFF
ncbi:hypothetical protein QDY65_00555 [Pyrococcus kukulkanii]|uniref:Uncharacterized protein n=1 Tax=Pyrococcus kukulkanii TaxID=1609559 RepID=A0A127BE24_9EURY|nr:hypothetical protein [Pyrococcus kukulkanii]AMM54896.1 hypothetical protein TQ32_10680 [Pyrococcus kukulkanii]